MEILLDLENNAREKRAVGFSRYRRFLESLDDKGALPEKDRPAFRKLVEELDLTADDIRSHVASLTKHRQGLETERRAQAMELERAGLEEPIAEFVAKRDRIVAELEAEGGPLIRRATDLDARITNLAWGRTAAVDEEGNFPELYGCASVTPAPESATRRNFEQEQHDLSDRSLCESLAANLRGAADDAAPVLAMPGWHREILARGVSAGWVVVSDIHAAALKPAEVERREVTDAEDAE